MPPQSSRPTSDSDSTDTVDVRTVVRWSLLVSVLALVVPYAGVVLYPLEVSTTFIHEIGHALATAVSGGRTTSLEVGWDGAGGTRSIGGSPGLVAAAGYGMTLSVGLAVLVCARRVRWTSALLVGLGGACIVSTLVWTELGSAPAILAAAGLGVFLLGLGRYFAATDRPTAKVNFLGAVALTGALAYGVMTLGSGAWTVGLAAGTVWVGLGALAPVRVVHAAAVLWGLNLCFDGVSALQNQVMPGLVFPTRGHSDAAGLVRTVGANLSFWTVLWAGLAGLSVAAIAWWYEESPPGGRVDPPDEPDRAAS